MALIKVIEIMSDSTTSWEEATKNAVAEASKTIKNIKSAYVQEQSCVVDNGKVSSFRVNVKISFAVNK